MSGNSVAKRPRRSGRFRYLRLRFLRCLCYFRLRRPRHRCSHRWNLQSRSFFTSGLRFRSFSAKHLLELFTDLEGAPCGSRNHHRLASAGISTFPGLGLPGLKGPKAHQLDFPRAPNTLLNRLKDCVYVNIRLAFAAVQRLRNSIDNSSLVHLFTPLPLRLEQMA